MTDRALTIEEFLRLLARAAGSAEGGPTGEAAVDTEFDTLGYDSLALLETASLVEHEYGVKVDDDVVGSRTPREFLACVNDIITAGRPA
jgi:act minimal PKS acyl carrier protein